MRVLIQFFRVFISAVLYVNYVLSRSRPFARRSEQMHSVDQAFVELAVRELIAEYEAERD